MAYYNNRREPVEEIETKVWSCTAEDCAGWMRVDYSFDQNPVCPLCNSEMHEETKILPIITKQILNEVINLGRFIFLMMFMPSYFPVYPTKNNQL